MVVNPGREPKHSGTCICSQALGLSKKETADTLLSGRFLNIEAQELSLITCWSKFVLCAQRDLGKANQMTGSFSDEESGLSVSNGLLEHAFGIGCENFACDGKSNAIGCVSVKEDLHCQH